jgi:hypothetical protein
MFIASSDYHCKRNKPIKSYRRSNLVRFKDSLSVIDQCFCTVGGAIALGDYVEAGSICFLFTLADWLESRSTDEVETMLFLHITSQRGRAQSRTRFLGPQGPSVV